MKYGAPEPPGNVAVFKFWSRLNKLSKSDRPCANLSDLRQICSGPYKSKSTAYNHSRLALRCHLYAEMTRATGELMQSKSRVVEHS